MWTDEQKDQVKSLLTRFCDASEVCSVLDCAQDELDGLCLEAFGADFAATMEKYSAQGRAMLKRAQFDLALEGDRTMLQVLGRDRLGQESAAYHPRQTKSEGKQEADEQLEQNRWALKALQRRYAPASAASGE